MKFLKIMAIIIAVFVVGTTITTMIGFAGAPQVAPEKCSPSIRVKMGEHVFFVPRGKHGYLSNGEADIITWPCTQNDNEALDITFFSMSLYGVEGFETRGARQNEGFSTRVGVSFLPESYKSIDSYSKAIADSYLNPEKIKTMPIKGGFYEIEYLPKQFILIPVDEHFKTPNGNPVAFICSPYGNEIDTTLYCATGFNWHDDLYIGFDSLSEAWVPREEFKKFYLQVFDYVQSLEQSKKNSTLIQEK